MTEDDRLKKPMAAKTAIQANNGSPRKKVGEDAMKIAVATARIRLVPLPQAREPVIG